MYALLYVIPLLYIDKDESAFNRNTRENKPTPYWNEVKAHSLPFPSQDRFQMALRTGKAFPRARIRKKGFSGFFALNGGATQRQKSFSSVHCVCVTDSTICYENV